MMRSSRLLAFAHPQPHARHTPCRLHSAPPHPPPPLACRNLPTRGGECGVRRSAEAESGEGIRSAISQSQTLNIYNNQTHLPISHSLRICVHSANRIGEGCVRSGVATGHSKLRWRGVAIPKRSHSPQRAGVAQAVGARGSQAPRRLRLALHVYGYSPPLPRSPQSHGRRPRNGAGSRMHDTPRGPLGGPAPCLFHTPSPISK